MNIKTMCDLVIDALEDIKAKDIVLINVSKLTSMFDYIAVASGDSNRQTRALASHVAEKLKDAGATVIGTEGEETGEWVLVDLGDIVVHIMQPVTREYYRLEELWSDGKIEFPKPEKSASRLPTKAPDKTPARTKVGTTARKKPATVKKQLATRTRVGSKVGAKVGAKTTAAATVKSKSKSKATTASSKVKSTTAVRKKPAAKTRVAAKPAPKAKSKS